MKKSTEKNGSGNENRKVIELLDNAIEYLSLDDRKEKAELYLKIEGFLKKEGFFGLKLKEEIDPDQMCKEVLIAYLERNNYGVIIPNLSQDQKVEKLIFKNQFVEVAISRGVEYLEKNKYLKELVNIIETVINDFITPLSDLFKARIVLGENFFSMRMDPGKHKEFLGVIFSSSGKDVLIHKHFPSEYEKKSANHFRQKYVQKVTDGKINYQNRQVVSLKLVKNFELLKKGFQKFFRLCQSVKNLDLKNDDLIFSVNMFEAGVVNMENFLQSCDLCDELKTREHFDDHVLRCSSINDEEKNVLANYFENNVMRKEKIRKSLENLRKAKDLNFEIIRDLIELEKEVRMTLGVNYEQPKRAKLLRNMYRDIAKKLIKMEELVVNISIMAGCKLGSRSVATLVNEMEIHMEPIISLARMGYGASVPIRDCNDEIDLGEIGRKRLSAKGLYAYDQFSKIIDEQGGQLEEWGDINSLQEAVRFLHASVVRISNLYVSVYGQEYKALFIRKRKMDRNWSYVSRILDASSDGLEETEIGEIVIKTIEGLGIYNKRDVFDSKKFDKVITMIFSDNVFEITLPTGKHYIELNAQSYEGVNASEHTICWRHMESCYKGALHRQDFVATVLKKNRFIVIQEGRFLNGFFKTARKSEWKENLKMVVTLIMSIKDLDLGLIQEDTLSWFEHGVVTLFRSFRNISSSLFLKSPDDWSKNEIRFIMKIGSISEKNLLAEMLSSKMKIFKRDIAPYLEKLNSDQLDDFITALFSLEEKSRREKNKKLVFRLRRIQDHCINLMDEPETK